MKEFKPRDKVLLFNSKVKLFRHKKLRSKWDGLFTVMDTSLHGAITLQDDEGNTSKVNGQCLKVFFENDKSPDEEVDVIDLIDF